MCEGNLEVIMQNIKIINKADIFHNKNKSDIKVSFKLSMTTFCITFIHKNPQFLTNHVNRVMELGE